MKDHKFIRPYLVKSGKGFRLKDYDPGDTAGFKSEDKPEAKRVLEDGVKTLSALQDILYAQASWGLLVILQGLDAAGKDSLVKHVTSGVNPQGVDVYPFKTPSTEELAHDFLWRSNLCLPPRGKIAIFNRSYYEEVLIVRVHPAFLDRQEIPVKLRGHHFWKHRYEDINAFERYLGRNGIVIRKFALHLSKAEQKRRFLARIEDREKNWKFSENDVIERKYWDDYQDAYEKMICNTATEYAPWIIVPADNKWFSRLLVVASINDALDSLKLDYPKVTADKKRELKSARKKLEKE